MSRLLVLITLTVLVLQAAIGQYTVRLRVGKTYEYQNQNEWATRLDAEIFDSNNNFVATSSGFYYDWRIKKRYDEPFELYREGLGSLYEYVEPDGQRKIEPLRPGVNPSSGWEMFEIYCRITIEGSVFTTNTIRVPDEGNGLPLPTRYPILFDQKRQSGLSEGRIGRVVAQQFFNYPVPFVNPQNGFDPETLWASSGSNDIFKATQALLQNPSEKYNNWQGFANVVNHQTFTIDGNKNLIAKLKTVNNPTIQTCVAEGGFVASSVEFKDPWLVDDNSDPLGPRNRGTNAVFVSKSTPFYPLNDANTKGVFLGENPTFDPQKPIYSVRAVQPIYATGLIWNFSYWTTSNASVSSSTSLQTDVVFSSNATVTANYNIVVKPQALDGVSIGEEYDGKIGLTWSDHPSANVTQYMIYRKVTPYGGQPGQPTLIATLNRGTTTYKDNAYYYSDNHLTNYIAYDVRCYHQPSGTYSDPRWWETFGSTRPSQAAGSAELLSSKRKPSTITFEGYPNPFNPSTKLMYSLREDSYVQLRVYDVLGRTVAELAEGFQRAGYYSYTWSALKEVTGIYFARLIVKSEQEKPSILTSKLLLAK